MRRILGFISVVLTLSFMLPGCTANYMPENVEEQSSSQTENVEEESASVMPSPTTIVSYASYERFENLSDYISGFVDSIIVGTIVKPPTVTRINATELGYVSGSEEVWNNVTSYQIRVDDVLLGTKTKGEMITVDQYGGTVEGITEVVDGYPFLEESATYLMFLQELKALANSPYYKIKLLDPYDGFPEVVDGNLVPNEDSNYFVTSAQKEIGFSVSKAELANVGMPLEDAKKMIQNAIQEAAQKGNN